MGPCKKLTEFNICMGGGVCGLDSALLRILNNRGSWELREVSYLQVQVLMVVIFSQVSQEVLRSQAWVPGLLASEAQQPAPRESEELPQG